LERQQLRERWTEAETELIAESLRFGEELRSFVNKFEFSKEDKKLLKEFGVTAFDNRIKNYDLRGINLESEDLSNINLNVINLQGSRLRGTNLTGSSLIKADLSGVDLIHAVLVGANLRYVDLQASYLINSNISLEYSTIYNKRRLSLYGIATFEYSVVRLARALSILEAIIGIIFIVLLLLSVF